LDARADHGHQEDVQSERANEGRDDKYEDKDVCQKLSEQVPEVGHAV
jgi:hypothetical protein